MLKIANKVGINFALLTQPTQSKSMKAIKLQFDHSIAEMMQKSQSRGGLQSTFLSNQKK